MNLQILRKKGFAITEVKQSISCNHSTASSEEKDNPCNFQPYPSTDLTWVIPAILSAFIFGVLTTLLTSCICRRAHTRGEPRWGIVFSNFPTLMIFWLQVQGHFCSWSHRWKGTVDWHSWRFGTWQHWNGLRTFTYVREVLKKKGKIVHTLLALGRGAQSAQKF